MVALLVLCLLAVPGGAVGARDTVAAAQPITVTATVHVEDISGREEIWLTGISADPDVADLAEDHVLALLWRLDFSGWFPTWQLELSSAVGLLPSELPVREAGAFPSVVLARVQPVAGHTYEVTLSYSPALGAFSYRIFDLTNDRLLQSGGYSVPGYDEPLYAVAGEATPQYLPVATTWQMGMEADRAFLALQHFDTREDAAAVRVQVPVAAPGEYRLYRVADGADGDDVLVASFAPEAGEHRFPIDLSEFPYGSSTLRLDYVLDGETLLSELRKIVVGRVNFSLQPLAPDREARVVESQFTVQTEAPVDVEVLVDVHATLFELVWDSETRNFVEVPYMQGVAAEDVVLDLSSGSATLPVSVPMPDHHANWKLVLTAEVEPDMAVTLAGHERLFSTHLPAEVQPGEAYSIVVFPDTQNMSQSYPTVYTRMTDWVTSQAAERNIALVLHVGDITNHDTPVQWTNAYRSMSLLHGVVPYVLTLGNHDMTAGRGGAVWARGLSLINNYFKVEEAERYSNLAGTMVPGRLENHYHLFTIGDDKYLVIALEFGPPDEALEWANEIAAQYPDHRLILLTHSYTSNAGGLSRSPEGYEIAANPETTVNTAYEMWEKLVYPNANSFMVVSGHTWPEAPVVPFRVPRAAAGHPVFELLFDWQAEPNGGNGWLGILTFHPDDTLEVVVYSPYLGEVGNYRDSRGFTSRTVFDLNTGAAQRLVN